MADRAGYRRGPCTTRKEFMQRLFVAESVTVFIAMPFALLFFFQTVPFAVENLKAYTIIIAILFAITRIPNHLLVTKMAAVPCFEWMEARKGRVSQSDLSRYYVRLTGVVPMLLGQAALIWALAGTGMVISVGVLMGQSAFTLLTLAYTALITMCISLCFSYFAFHSLTRPFIEEVAALLAETPSKGVFRFPLALKVGASVFAITCLSFIAFGLLMYVKSQAVFEQYALAVNEEAGKNLRSRFDEPESLAETDALLRAYSNPTRLFSLVDLEGVPLSSVNADQVDEAMTKAARAAAKQGVERSTRTLLRGPVEFFRTRRGQAILVLMPNPEAIAGGVHSILTVTGVFLVCILVILGAYIFWLSRELSRLMKLTDRFSSRLAVGDLTELPAVWSDDELGHLMDNLRATFRGLVRVTREMKGASASVEGEAGRLSSTSHALAAGASEQTALAGETENVARATGEGAREAAASMAKVANATQDVSATILQMQASVEEMAGTAEVLGQSVETTVSSTNEIATTAEQVRAATAQLQQSGQEAVSFLTELDASLGETRESSAALSKLASQVTGQAEGGFSRVAAVEEEILRTLRVSEESHRALGDLQTSLESIGRILDVIQDITEQTNLLSLNASIIAAGAGEHGKAFGVVAAQIRDLSSKTRVRAGEIRRVIRSLQTGGAQISESMERVFTMVDRSAALSRDAGASLRTILESASSQEEMSKRIAAATEELAHGGQAASQTMHMIFERIEGIVRSVEEQARSTRLLSREAERVREVVLQLHHATEEQSRGAQMIARAAADISKDAQGTTEIVESQAARAAETAAAMQGLTTKALETQRAFEGLAEASGRLRESASALDREVGRFRLPEG